MASSARPKACGLSPAVFSGSAPNRRVLLLLLQALPARLRGTPATNMEIRFCFWAAHFTGRSKAVAYHENLPAAPRASCCLRPPMSSLVHMYALHTKAARPATRRPVPPPISHHHCQHQSDIVLALSNQTNRHRSSTRLTSTFASVYAKTFRPYAHSPSNWGPCNRCQSASLVAFSTAA